MTIAQTKARITSWKNLVSERHPFVSRPIQEPAQDGFSPIERSNLLIIIQRQEARIKAAHDEIAELKDRVNEMEEMENFVRTMERRVSELQEAILTELKPTG